MISTYLHNNISFELGFYLKEIPQSLIDSTHWTTAEILDWWTEKCWSSCQENIPNLWGFPAFSMICDGNLNIWFQYVLYKSVKNALAGFARLELLMPLRHRFYWQACDAHRRFLFSQTWPTNVLALVEMMQSAWPANLFPPSFFTFSLNTTGGR